MKSPLGRDYGCYPRYDGKSWRLQSEKGCDLIYCLEDNADS